MRRLWVLALLFCASCSAVDFPTAGAPAQATPVDQVQASPMPSQAVLLATPAPTSDALATQMALIHALETKQAEVNLLQLQSRQADVAIANAAASAAAANAESEKYKAAQADAIARQKQADAQLVAAQASQTDADNQARQLALQADQAAADEARARTNQIMIVSLVAVLAIGTIALLRLVSLRTRQFEASMTALDPIDKNEADPAPVVQVNEPRPEAYAAVTQSEFRGVSVVQLRAVAEGVAGNIPLSYEAWTGADKPFSRGQWSTFVMDLIAKELATVVDVANVTRGVVLTETGKAFFEHVRSLPSPARINP